MSTTHVHHIIAAIAKAPCTLTQLCFAVEAPPSQVLPRLKHLARKGLIVNERVFARTDRKPWERMPDTSRVIWRLKDQATPTYQQLTPLIGSPPAAPAERKRKRKNLDPWTKDARGPLEILAMLAGRTNYTEPSEGRSTADPRITPLDVAQAISWAGQGSPESDGQATAPNPIGAAMGLAIACQRASEWPTVHGMAVAPLLRELRQQRAMPGVVAGALRFRVRLVLHDVFNDLIRPQQRTSYRAAAQASNIAVTAYKFLNRHITAYLQAKASEAASDACAFLFRPFAESAMRGTSKRAALVISDGETVQTYTGNTPQEIAVRSPDLLDFLLEEMLKPGARQRTLGVLTLNNRPHIVVYVQQE